MNRDELRARAHYLRSVERLSTRQIGETLGISRGKCIRLLRDAPPGDKVPRVSSLDPHKSLIAEWYSEHPTLSAAQVHTRLAERGIPGSYTTVKRFTRQFRKKRPPFHFPLQFSPGEEAQVDWFVIDHPKLGRLAGFAYVLSYSRFLFARIFPKMSFEFFIEGHLRAFEASLGIPRALRYDNLRSVVIRRTPLTYNSSFLAFAEHHQFHIRLCNVRAGQEKGRVERAIRTIREGFLNVADQHHSLDALNDALTSWVRTRNETLHRTTEKAPVTLLLAERLRPMPGTAWINRLVHPPKLPTKTGLIIFECNQYSVPEHLSGVPLTVHAFCDRIEIFAERDRVARHPRSFERGALVINPLHRSFTKIRDATKTERIVRLVTGMDPYFTDFLERSDDHERTEAAYAIFRLLCRHARAAVVSCARECVIRGTVSVRALYDAFGLPTERDTETVRPQAKRLLDITYQPRLLEEYS
jgi:transposase